MIKVDQIVSEFLDEINGGQAEFSKAYRIAVRGVRELNYDVTGETKQTLLVMNPDGTSTLPEDCYRVEKIGHLNGNGTITALDHDNDLSKGYNQGSEEDTLYYPHSFPKMRPVGYEYMSPSLGRGSYTNKGRYRLDNRTVFFGSEVCCDNLAIEYHSLPHIDGSLAIHEFASEALLSWIRWKWNIQRRDVSGQEKMMYAQEYKIAKTLAKNRILQPTKQQLNQYVRSSIKGGLKS